MTEPEWNSCQDPQKMLEFLRDSGRASERKLRLFACACCRSVWPLLTEEPTRRAVTIGERFADARADRRELAAARANLPASLRGQRRELVMNTALSEGQPGDVAETRAAAWAASWDAVKGLVRATAWEAARDVVGAIDVVRRLSKTPLAKHDSPPWLLREVLGPVPFRPVGIDPALLKWDDGLVVNLARATYDDRRLPEGFLDPGRLAVLADALEDAGGTNEEILSHLRQQDAVHVRGCWVVDHLLGMA